MTKRLLAALAALSFALPGTAPAAPVCERGSKSSCEFRREAPAKDPLAATLEAPPKPPRPAPRAGSAGTGSPAAQRPACDNAKDGKRRDRC